MPLRTGPLAGGVYRVQRPVCRLENTRAGSRARRGRGGWRGGGRRRWPVNGCHARLPAVCLKGAARGTCSGRAARQGRP